MNKKNFYLNTLIYLLIGLCFITFAISIYNKINEPKLVEIKIQKEHKLNHSNWWMNYKEVDSLIRSNKTFFLQTFWYGMTEKEFRNVIRRSADLEYPTKSFNNGLKSGKKDLHASYLIDDIFVDRNYYDTVNIDQEWIMINSVWGKSFKEPVFVHFEFKQANPKKINSVKKLNRVYLSIEIKDFNEYDAFLGFINKKYSNYYNVTKDEYGWEKSSLFIKDNINIFINTSRNKKSKLPFKVDLIYFDNRYFAKIPKPLSYQEKVDSLKNYYELKENERQKEFEKEFQRVF